MNFKALILLAMTFYLSSNLMAQELQATVKINVGGNGITSDPSIFRTLEVDLTTFFNKTKWTNDDYKDHEKIKFSIQINVESETTQGFFIGSAIVKSGRPVYNSNYETPVVSFIDQSFAFPFIVGQVIQRSDNVFYDNLSSTMTFVAYMVLGYDYDTFSPFGGDPYFSKAVEVRNSLPNSLKNSVEWNNGIVNGRNKFWFINDMIDPRIKPFRSFMYNYHRTILDMMYEDPDKQRAILTNEIMDLNKVIESYPNSMALQVFTDSKRSEIIEIFKLGDDNQKSRVYNTMLAISPALSNVFEVLNR